MSALAQFQAMKGGRVSGSDRTLGKAGSELWKEPFDKLGIVCYPQDGSGVQRDVSSVVQSTAVENDNPDIKKAHELSIPVIHRSRVLSDFVNGHRTLAVAGTSGKSTVTAMVYEILRHAALSPSVITGGALVSLQDEGLLGNAGAGTSDILAVEADESDGTLVEYAPFVGLLLNIEKDHKEIPELLNLFRKFCANSRICVVNHDQPLLSEFVRGAISFGHSEGATYRMSEVTLKPDGSSFLVNGVLFSLPCPGLYNAENALAAASACASYGVSLECSSEALSAFKGVARRFQMVGVSRNGVEVIDDYAHNPAKLRAAIEACKLRAGRVIAVYQPHGFGPTRFLKNELIIALSESLRAQDRLLMPEIYYAGGTVSRDISSRDIVEGVSARGGTAHYFEQREALLPYIPTLAQKGDCVLVMGARDPSLSDFARSILAALNGSPERQKS